jgi:hypothetical protein
MLVFNGHGAPVWFGARDNADSYQAVSLFACKALNLAGLVLRQFYRITGVRVNQIQLDGVPQCTTQGR